ncbi:MAG: TusE/DsrC/DsvC family sulfur relay protein [Bacteroidota bacterium]
MGYVVDDVELETDGEGYLREADYRDEVCTVIAAEEGLTLTDGHWKVINFLRDKYREDGHTPNLRNLMKGLQEEGGMPEADSKLLFDLFPAGGAAKQGCKVGGLPQPKGKGGY